MLQVKLLDIGAPKAILKLALQPPDIEDIETTVLLLKQVRRSETGQQMKILVSQIEKATGKTRKMI